ncbi:MAG: Gfo/Idh/MocA family oxidoreductase [Lewinella sp.]|nr:Gfo/Idh/MocA family oxidoreductase [Lewinella sp.]
MKTTPIRFAVVGVGHIGKRHAAIIAGHPEAELVALCDVCPPEELGLANDQRAVPFYDSLDDLLADGLEVDVVNICTPNGLHAEQAIQALAARRHVVIEKPMALHRQDAERVIHQALHAGRQVFCVMQNRYSPAAAWLKEVVEQGHLGDLHLVQLSCLWNRDERYYRLPNAEPHPWHGSPELDGGVLFTQFAHFIDLLYWVFGDIGHIRAQFANRRGLTPFPDTGEVQFTLRNGALGSLQFSTAIWDRNFHSSITVAGSRGSLQIAGQYMNELTHCHIEGLEPPTLAPTPPPNDYGGYTGSAANHHFVIQNVIDTLRGHGRITTNALEGMKVVEIIERIYGGD